MSRNSTRAPLFFIFLASLLTVAQPASAQSGEPLKTEVAKKKLVAELERAIPELMNKANIPGLSIAVVRDGRLFWSRGFGVKNARTNEPVTGTRSSRRLP
jgi:CubicO group peptidase (beta-lactamase class C family)